MLEGLTELKKAGMLTVVAYYSERIPVSIGQEKETKVSDMGCQPCLGDEPSSPSGELPWFQILRECCHIIAGKVSAVCRSPQGEDTEMSCLELLWTLSL